MKGLIWIGLFLEVSPILAFTLLAVLHPLGDPQESGILLMRLLDYQGTFWLRRAIPVPPPLLLAGTSLMLPLWARSRSRVALLGSIAGVALLGLWSLVMLVPMLVHVN